MARTRVKSIQQTYNELFDVLKFSPEQRAEAVVKVEYEDTKHFVANPKSDRMTGDIVVSHSSVTVH